MEWSGANVLLSSEGDVSTKQLYSLFFVTWPLSYPKTDNDNIEQGQSPGARLGKTDSSSLPPPPSTHLITAISSDVRLGEVLPAYPPPAHVLYRWFDGHRISVVTFIRRRNYPIFYSYPNWTGFGSYAIVSKFYDCVPLRKCLWIYAAVCAFLQRQAAKMIRKV